MFRTLVYVLIDSCWILLIGVVLVSVSPSGSIGADAPSTISYIATGESCCGEDPHPVHGVATSDGGFVLVGKSLDLEGEWEGFVVKFPPYLPTGTLWLEPGEEFSYQWSYSFGSDGNKDGANSVAATKDAVFVAGFLTNSSGLIDRYLAKLDLISGNLIWNVTLPSKHSSGESAFESIQLTKDGGLIATGFVAGKKGELEGFKSYGNPQSGNAFLMYLDAEQISASSNNPQPTWEQFYNQALSGKAVREITGHGRGYVLASSNRDEKPVAMVLRIDGNGELIWSKKYPKHGELTDITLLRTKGLLEGFALAGHRHLLDGGVDGIITKISTDGSVVWNKSYGNPVGGNGIFNGLDAGNKKLIYDECWSIQSTEDGGAIMACGTGIEGCEPYPEDTELFAECIDDPRNTWRSMLLRVNQKGDLIWQRVDSYQFVEDNDGGENEEVPSSASEYVIITNEGHIASITDLAFGIGLQLLEKE